LFRFPHCHRLRQRLLHSPYSPGVSPLARLEEAALQWERE
jgi:hypothetical protein